MNCPTVSSTTSSRSPPDEKGRPGMLEGRPPFPCKTRQLSSFHIVIKPPTHLPSDWIEVTLQTDPVTREAVSDFLMDMPGCEGVLVDESDAPVLKAYLPGEGTSTEKLRLGIEAFLSRLASFFPGAGPSSFRLDRIRDQDWRTAWRKHFRPVQVTPRLLILPAWDPVPAKHMGHILRMDPGPAFGTGTHPTTRMCLQAMEDFAPKGPFSLLDVGTGSGILAMYGVLLGASPVEAVDVDETALRWAEWNLDLNGLKGSVRLSSNPMDKCNTRFSMVTANLVLDVILDLMPGFAGVVGPGGILVLSGLLGEQIGIVTPALSLSGFEVAGELREEEWACIVTRPHEKAPSKKGVRS